MVTCLPSHAVWGRGGTGSPCPVTSEHGESSFSCQGPSSKLEGVNTLPVAHQHGALHHSTT